jgi:hypothetical protein
MGMACVGEPSTVCLKSSAQLEKPSILRSGAFCVLDVVQNEKAPVAMLGAFHV